MKTHSFIAALVAVSSVAGVAAQDPQLGKTSIDKVINAMTLDEKIDLLVGSSGNVKNDDAATVGGQAEIVPGAAGQTNGVPRLGIPATVVADGPAGLRIDSHRKGTDRTFYCTHFPVTMALCSTWDTTLIRKVGAAMGDEVKHYGVDVLLAPATNIQRNPLCGRNFEYYSEDPLLAGDMCAAEVAGVQSAGVGTSLKHFAINNQETNRVRNNVLGTPRTFREIYLKPFEIVVKKAQPLTVMTSYNKINGTMTSERCDLVTEILRKEWGFKGMVMTDWYGGISAARQIAAGNDLLMPGALNQREELKRAVNNGTLSLELVDRDVKHVLNYIQRTPRFAGYVADNNPDLAANALTARAAAVEGMVLLKNNRSTLPLGKKVKKLAAFGCTSYDFIAGGTGSGNVNHAYVVNLIDGLHNAGFTTDATVQAAYDAYIPKAKASLPERQGKYGKWLPPYRVDEMKLDNALIEAAAKANDAAVVTIGKISGEFLDREVKGNFNLTDAERNMLSAVSRAFHKAGKRVVVVLNVCGAIETASWIGDADAVLVSWLPGQEGGNSVADLLAGRENPSGRLPMTWPVKYTDVPSAANFPETDSLNEFDLQKWMELESDHNGDNVRKNVDYTEYADGVYVGYRYYTTRGVAVSFPFGYGLSYTTFAYGKPQVEVAADGSVTATVEVRNSGRVAGREVVQAYVAAPGRDMDKPSRELRGFAKTALLQPGETQRVTINIPYESLASFNEQGSCWQVEPGQYTLMFARSAADAKPLVATFSEQGGVTSVVRPCLLPEQK